MHVDESASSGKHSTTFLCINEPEEKYLQIQNTNTWCLHSDHVNTHEANMLKLFAVAHVCESQTFNISLVLDIEYLPFYGGYLVDSDVKYLKNRDCMLNGQNSLLAQHTGQWNWS